MAIQEIKVGLSENDGTGDPWRTAFTKANGNFADLDSRIGDLPSDTDVSTAIETAVAAAASALKGGADAGHDTLQKLALLQAAAPTAGDITAAVAAAVPALKGGADSAHDTLQKLAAIIAALAVADINGLAAALAAKAPLASPPLTGTPTAPTPATDDNSTQIATTGFVRTALAAIVGAAPSTLDTIAEIDAAIGNDPNFATTVMTALAGKQAALGFTPENVANKAQPGGYASLGADGKVPAAQLPVASQAGTVNPSGSFTAGNLITSTSADGTVIGDSGISATSMAATRDRANQLFTATYGDGMGF